MSTKQESIPTQTLAEKVKEIMRNEYGYIHQNMSTEEIENFINERNCADKTPAITADRLSDFLLSQGATFDE